MRSIPFGKLLVAFAGYLLLSVPKEASAASSYTVNDITVQEGNTGTPTATFTVTRSQTGTTETVSYYTHPTTVTATEGTACGGNVDYIGVRGTRTFSGSERSKTIDIRICPDYTPEQNEVIMILVGKTIAKCTILNDDSPNVSILDHGDTEGRSIEFRVSLSQPPAQTVNVYYTVTSQSPMHGTADTATAGTSCGGSADYITRTDVVAFYQGQVEKSIYVQTCSDTTIEQHETFSVILTRAEGAIISDNSARGTIVNDDLPVLTVGDLSASEPPNGTGLGSVQFCYLTLSSPIHDGCRIDYRAVQGSAWLSSYVQSCSSAQSDLWNISGTVYFPAGDQSESIRVGICDDTSRENTETFQIQFSNPVGLSAPDLVADCTITDND